MFHVEHAKNQKSAKKQICGFFYFSEKIEKIQIMLDFFYFLARGRQCECEAFSTNVTQLCVTAEVAKGVVFYGVIGAGAPVVVRRRFASDAPRRLYSARTNLSSLFCDPEHIRATIFRLLKKAPKRSVKMAPIIQYSSDAVKYYLAVRPNSGKLMIVSAGASKLGQRRDNFRQL